MTNINRQLTTRKIIVTGLTRGEQFGLFMTPVLKKPIFY